MKVYRTTKYEIPVGNPWGDVFERIPYEEDLPEQFKHKLDLHYTGRGDLKLIIENGRLRPPKVGERLIISADGCEYNLGKIIEIYDVPISWTPT